MSAPALRTQPHALPNSFLPYGRQLIEDDDIAAVAEALRGEFLTTGPNVERFEAALARTVGAKHAVVCSNGTAALYMAARALGIGQGSKVIVPAITFLATASAPHLNGAEIVFADVDSETGLMRPEDLKAAFARAGGADAVFNVHVNGQCGDIEAIAKVARLNGALVLEDACHAIGTGFIPEDGGVVQIGSNAFCDLTVFSFHPVKTIAMGEGGAVTTNDPEIAKRLARVRNHGVLRNADEFENAAEAFDSDGTPNPWYYELAEPSFNFRANDMQCALGLSQLGKLGRFVARRRALAAAYDTLLAPLAPLVRPTARTRPCLPAWHLYASRIDFARAGISRATVMRELAKDGIGSQVHYMPVHRQAYYVKRYGALSLPGADRYYANCLSLPLFVSMSMDDVARVATTLANILGF